MPSLASTACTWSLHEVRSLTSLCRYAEARIMPMPGGVGGASLSRRGEERLVSRPGGRGHGAGLLARYADGFRAELLGQGYTQGSAARQIHLMAHLSRWLEARGLELAALDERVASQF